MGFNMIEPSLMIMKSRKWLWSFVILSVIFVHSGAESAPPLPARIGGTVTVNGTQLTQETDTGYTFVVTKQNGTSYDPAAEDTDGLNAYNWYNIDIPIYDPYSQPGGANPGDTAIIRVYKDNSELTVASPENGQLTVGMAGSIIQINLTSTIDATTVYVDPHGLCGSKSPCCITIQEGIEESGVETTINAAEGTYIEDILMNQAKDLVLKGGWDSTFTNKSSFTLIKGSMTISSGKVTVENLVLQ